MRSYDEQIEVDEGRIGASGDSWLEGPERFRWRGRLMLVQQVLARWVETGAWWDAPLVRAVRGDDVRVMERGRTTNRGRTHEGRAPATVTAENRGRRGVFGGLPPAAMSDVWQTAADDWGRQAERRRKSDVIPEEVDLLAEHELWRVLARPAARAGDLADDEVGGIYELDHAWGTGAWRLRAVLD
jgi:hypothetical protein